MAALFIVVAITVVVLAGVLLFAVIASRDGARIAAGGRRHAKQVAIESGEPDPIEELSDLVNSIDVGQMLRERLADPHTAVAPPPLAASPAAPPAHSAGGPLAPARIITAEETGTLVNGTTPLVRFELQVEPSGATAFAATIQDMIPAGSVAKYQPGSIVWVRYDPSTPTWVAFDRS